MGCSSPELTRTKLHRCRMVAQERKFAGESQPEMHIHVEPSEVRLNLQTGCPESLAEGQLVQPGKERLGLAWAQMAGNGFGLFAIVALRPNAHPIAVLAGELDHV